MNPFQSVRDRSRAAKFTVEMTKIMERCGEYRTSWRVLRSQRRGAVTVIELFAVWFVIAVPLITFQAVAPSFGKWAGIVAALISAVASVKAVARQKRATQANGLT